MSETIDKRAAAEKVLSGIRFLAGKRLPIKFPNDETAMAITSIIENAGNVARAYLAIRAELSTPEARDRIADLERENARMREALEWYANPEVYKAHPHGPAFDDRDLSWCARSALHEDTT